MLKEQQPVAWQLTFHDESHNPQRSVFYSKEHLDRHVNHNTNVRNLGCLVTPFYTKPVVVQQSQQDDNIDYAVALQSAIEYHCRGKIVPESAAKLCPYHAKMLDVKLIKEQLL